MLKGFHTLLTVNEIDFMPERATSDFVFILIEETVVFCGFGKRYWQSIKKCVGVRC